MMNVACFVFASLLSISYGQMYCGNVMCPQGTVCKNGYQCVATMFQCPQVYPSNTMGFKQCFGMNGMNGCNTYQGEKCCNSICVSGPVLVSAYGNGGFNGNGNGGIGYAENGGSMDGGNMNDGNMNGGNMNGNMNGGSMNGGNMNGGSMNGGNMNGGNMNGHVSYAEKEEEKGVPAAGTE